MSAPRRRIPVAVLGATGSVGQRFVALLENHPWFRLHRVAASARSQGKPYGEAVRWLQSTPLPEAAARLTVEACEPDGQCPLVFSALDAEIALPVEKAFAESGALVVSNARAYRMDPRVPLLVPEINDGHLELLRRQPWAPGGIITNPNCSTIGLVLALKPLVDRFGVEGLHVVTLQAVSGAGVPGVSSFEMVDNVVPYIGGEEEKLQDETHKILGALENGAVTPLSFPVSAQCNRVPVLDGHTECVSIRLGRRAGPQEIIEAWNGFSGAPQAEALPSAPARPLHYLTDPAAPQPRLHRDRERGMAVTLGRLQPCPLLHYRFVLLSHNTVRGAAGGALLAAELAVARGHLAAAL